MALASIKFLASFEHGELLVLFGIPFPSSTTHQRRRRHGNRQKQEGTKKKLESRGCCCFSSRRSFVGEAERLRGRRFSQHGIATHSCLLARFFEDVCEKPKTKTKEGRKGLALFIAGLLLWVKMCTQIRGAVIQQVWMVLFDCKFIV